MIMPWPRTDQRAEMAVALDRHERGDARVIPVLVVPADFDGMLFAKLQGLPPDAKPVST